MSLQFYFGPSGSGKSRQLHMDMLALAEKNPEKNILFLVPDQFTMQTQFDLVNASKVKGIRNIDVLSFGRLSHRIFEETGYGTKPVLDDTGKSLVLRKVAAQITEALPVIGANLNKIGYIHEVKSAISEFMQYGMNPNAERASITTNWSGITMYLRSARPIMSSAQQANSAAAANCTSKNVSLTRRQENPAAYTHLHGYPLTRWICGSASSSDGFSP